MYVVVEDCFVKSMFIGIVRREVGDVETQNQQQTESRCRPRQEFLNPSDASARISF